MDGCSHGELRYDLNGDGSARVGCVSDGCDHTVEIPRGVPIGSALVAYEGSKVRGADAERYMVKVVSGRLQEIE
jgi:hypothetical protein